MCGRPTKDESPWQNKARSSAAAQFLTHNCRTNGRGRAIYHLRAIVHLKKRATVRPGHIRAPGGMAHIPSREREFTQPLPGHNAFFNTLAPFCYSSPPLELPLKTVHDGSAGGGMSRAHGAVGKCARSGYGLSLSKSGSRNTCDVVGLFVTC